MISVYPKTNILPRDVKKATSCKVDALKPIDLLFIIPALVHFFQIIGSTELLLHVILALGNPGMLVIAT